MVNKKKDTFDRSIPAVRINEDIEIMVNELRLYLHKVVGNGKGRMPSASDATRFAIKYARAEIDGF